MKRKPTIIIIFLIISISNISGQVIKQLGYFPGGGPKISSMSGFLVSATGHIVDVSNPKFPELTGQIYIDMPHNVTLSDSLAFFGTEMISEMTIANISDVYSPQKLSTLKFPDAHSVYDIEKKGNILYLSMPTEDTRSVDITDLKFPKVIDTLVNISTIDMAIKGNFAFGTYVDGLKVIDISNPSKMKFVMAAGSSDYRCICLSDSLAFLGKHSGGVDVYNISDPVNTSYAFSIETPGTNTVWDLIYRDKLLYLATNSRGLCIYQVNNNEGIELASFKNENAGQSFGVSVQDSLIFLSERKGIAILQFDRNANPDTTHTQIKNSFSTNKPIIIFPNPAKDYITVSSDNLIISEIGIIDKSGRRIKNINKFDIMERINISDLKNGHYIIRIKTKNKQIFKNFVKIE